MVREISLSPATDWRYCSILQTVMRLASLRNWGPDAHLGSRSLQSAPLACCWLRRSWSSVGAHRHASDSCQRLDMGLMRRRNVLTRILPILSINRAPAPGRMVAYPETAPLPSFGEITPPATHIQFHPSRPLRKLNRPARERVNVEDMYFIWGCACAL